MSEKFVKFKVALEVVCREHCVQLSGSIDGNIMVWNLDDGDEPIFADDLEDCTE